MRSGLVLVALVLGVGGIALANRHAPPTNAAIATQETLGAIVETDGWCTSVSTIVDLWASAPARITADERGRIRFVSVTNASTSNRVCVALGSSSGLTCADDSGTRGRLHTEGASVTYTIARDDAGAAPPPLYAVASSGSVTACVDVGW